MSVSDTSKREYKSTQFFPKKVVDLLSPEEEIVLEGLLQKFKKLDVDRYIVKNGIVYFDNTTLVCKLFITKGNY